MSFDPCEAWQAPLPTLFAFQSGLVNHLDCHANQEANLSQVSNEIISRCCSTISLATLFDGGVDTCRAALQESIAAGEAWRRAFQTTQSLVAAAAAAARAAPPKDGRAPAATSPKPTVSSGCSAAGQSPSPVAARMPQPWDFETSGIFAHVDAFMQRCWDLLEVCDAQAQFASKVELPCFGGTRGPEISKSLVDIQVRGVGFSRFEDLVWPTSFRDFEGLYGDMERLLGGSLVRKSRLDVLLL
jgi:dynein heavy chain